MDEDAKKTLYRQLILETDADTLLERMRLHGFWPVGEERPTDPQDDVVERTKIEHDISELQVRHDKAFDPEKALAKERIRRWHESKARRAAATADNEEQEKARRAAWNETRKETVVHAGPDVSAGLNQNESDTQRLTRSGLPVLHTAQDLAKLLDVEMPTLRWLTFHRRSAALVHYRRYDIPKKTGSVRHISAPKPRLAAAQKAVLTDILNRLHVDEAAHGFLAGHSIVSNAAQHVGRAVVINMDVADFFPSITFRRVKGLFAKLGYSEQVATVLALLCTEPPRAPLQYDGRVYHVALSERRLPQGACTSPALTNVICRRLDRRLRGLARKFDFRYTRYADDLTFSGDRPQVVGPLLGRARRILRDEGFEENPRKTHVMRQSQRQEVTGLTVNRRLNTAKEWEKELRAILHNVGRYGLESQNRDDHPNFAMYLWGRIAYVFMVNPQKGRRLFREFRRVVGPN